MRRRFRRRRSSTPPELNITSFMNLMVILVPFLLITAVFSQISILQLNLPNDSEQQKDQKKPPLVLEIVIRPKALDVRDQNTGRFKLIPSVESGYDIKSLIEKLRQIKQQYPKIVAVNILLEENTPYDSLIRVMDSVRSFKLEKNGDQIEYELFPEISIGDAPPATGKGAK